MNPTTRPAPHHWAGLLAVTLLLPMPSTASDDDFDMFAIPEVGITATIGSVPVEHNGETIWVHRNQDTTNTIVPAFALTSRPCPAFCIQPMTLAPGVETLGELEVLAYLERLGSDETIQVIDSRSASEFAGGAIPGAINVPWTELAEHVGAVDFGIETYLESFGVRIKGSTRDFSNARTLVLYCNGPWCGQSPTNIRTLLKLGYPADRLKWYRGGMQSWHLFGLTVTTPR